MADLMTRIKYSCKLGAIRARSWARVGAVLAFSAVALYAAYETMYFGLEAHSARPLPRPPVGLDPVLALVFFCGSVFFAYQFV